MSEFHFGVGHGRLADGLASKIDEIAREHGADFTNPKMPDGWRYWFSAPNKGATFDERTERKVFEALEMAGIAWPPETR